MISAPLSLERAIDICATALVIATTGALASCSAPSRLVVPAESIRPSPSPSAACSNASVIAGWTLERKAASLVVVPVLDFTLESASSEVDAGAGGVLFLGTAPPPHDLSSRISHLRRATSTGPVLVMADEEGGSVQRLAGAVGDVPSARAMAAALSLQGVRERARLVGAQMYALGVTVDLAPVMDVDDRPGPSDTNADGTRSFSGDAARAAAYAVAFERGLGDAGVLAVAKHFPGIGGVVGNSDVGAVATKPIDSLRTEGLVPFRAAIAAGVRAIMVANASVPGLTDLPASISRNVIDGLLRRELGFSGLVVTDSLSAGSIRAVTPSLAEAAVAAVSAGADMVLYGSTLTASDRAELAPSALKRNFDQIVAAIAKASRMDRISGARLSSAVLASLTARGGKLCG